MTITVRGSFILEADSDEVADAVLRAWWDAVKETGARVRLFENTRREAK